MTAELVLIRGLPGSGKSTIAEHLALVGYVHLEADRYFERNGPYQFDHLRLADAHSWCRDLVRKALERGEKVVVANTFTRMWEIDSYSRLAWDLDLVPLVITSRGNFKNIHGVSDEKIATMRARWEELPD